MKFYKKTVLVIGCLLITISHSNAQFLKDLGKRVEKSVENTISRKSEQKASEKTEEAMDGVFDAGKKKKEKESREASSNANVSSYSGAGYTFTFSATIEIDHPEKKNSDKTTMIQSYGKGSMLAEMNNQEIIYDFVKEDVLILNRDEKTAQVMSMKWFIKKAKSDDKDDVNMSYEKTGRSKIINGYASFEYLITHDDGKTIAWLAPNVPFDYEDYFKSFSKSLGKNAPNMDSKDGYVMEMSVFDKKGKETMHMLVIDLSKKPISISLANYSITKLM